MDSNDVLRHSIAAHDLENAPKQDYMGAFPKLRPQTAKDYIDELRTENERLRAESRYLVNVLRGVEHSLESCDDAEAERVQREVGRILDSFREKE